MEQLGKVINQVTKFVQERVPFLLGEQVHEFVPRDQVWVKDWRHDSLAPHWKGLYTFVLTTPMAVKVTSITLYSLFKINLKRKKKRRGSTINSCYMDFAVSCWD